MYNSEEDARQYEVHFGLAQGPVIGDSTHVTQYFYGSEFVEPRVSYWSGRPASLGEGFVGRKVEMDALSHAISSKPAVVISGGAGCGKTRLAVEYAHQWEGDGFWTTCGNTLALTLGTLVPALGIHPAGKSVAEIIAEVQVRLASMSPRVLWVIDNLPDLDLVNSLMNAVSSVRILVTTRDNRRGLLSPSVGFVRIGVLEPDTAKELLCSRSNVDQGHHVVQEIVDRVGCLPLALEALAVRLGEPRQSPERVLAQIEQVRTILQLKAFEEVAGMTIPRVEGVFATIAGTLEGLLKNVRTSLSFLGYVADAPIPEGLVMALTAVDDEALNEMLSVCGRQAILTWQDEQVTIHAMTVAAIAITNQEGVFETVVERAVSRLRKINKHDPIVFRSEVVHFEYLLGQARERFGVEDAAVQQVAFNLAYGYRNIGRVEEAIRLDEETLAIRERVLGPEHPDTLTSRSNLAFEYRDVGRHKDVDNSKDQG